ncbi:cysteine synthase family protein [candidate division WOR-3 bacterium]|nr:cysteine synthase family protein [candidate division WOR-3 bacterium]
MSVLTCIGNTPLVEITSFGLKKGIRLYGKYEGCNPGGSIKDRTALFMIQSAEEESALTDDKIILEPTSGNTGISLAMIGAAKGYKVTLVMPACVSTERLHTLEAFGAEVILTHAAGGTDGAILEAHKIMEENPSIYYMPNQFKNKDNIRAHYMTTAPEISAQTDKNIDVIVAGMGTTGTLMGISRYFREHSSGVRVIGIEPQPGHSIQGLKNMDESIVPAIYDPSMLDGKLLVEDGEAFDVTRQLVTREGIFVGMSSGAAVAGAIKVAQSMDSGIIVAILPDRGDRYLSTTLFRSICAKCPP